MALGAPGFYSRVRSCGWRRVVCEVDCDGSLGSSKSIFQRLVFRWWTSDGRECQVSRCRSQNGRTVVTDKGCIKGTAEK